MDRLPLLCHPSSTRPGIGEVTVQVSRPRAGLLVLNYRIEGDIGLLKMPVPAEPLRADELWKHTCFEAFVRVPDSLGYIELNFSPSGEWAMYRFDYYRQGMAVVSAAQNPRIACTNSGNSFEAHVEAALPSFEGVEKELSLAVSTVLETRDGQISYWALSHPPGKPDFHHADAFALRLPPPGDH